MPKYFRFPFARSGDKTAVPDAVVPAGDVSYDQGYGPYYQLAKTNPLAKDIERDKMNAVFNDITDAVRYIQELGVSAWIANSDNGGVAFPYAKGARVMYTDNKIYVSQKAANTSLPTVAADWFEETGRLIRTLVFIRVAGVQNVIIDGAAATPTGAGTYTPSASMKYIEAEIQGAGSGGAGSSGAAAGNVSVGSPGCSGSYARARFTAATIGASQTVTVGAGSAGSSGLVGGTSSLGALSTAPGGTGSAQVANVTPPTNNGNGTLAAAATGANLYSIRGVSPFQTVGLSAGVGYAGAGGSSPFGQGAPGPAFNTAGVAAINYGTGGSGTVVNQAGGTATGGAGADGIIIIREYA